MFHYCTPISEGASKIWILQVEKRINGPLQHPDTEGAGKIGILQMEKVINVPPQHPNSRGGR